MSRKSFSTPSITDLGSVEALTLAGQPAGRFDANYSDGQAIPAGGPGDGPTFLS